MIQLSGKCSKGQTWLAGQGILYPFKTISIHITDLCNSKCIFCGEDSPSQRKETITSDSIIEFIKGFSVQEWTAVNLHGGEPTIRPDIKMILTSIRGMGYGETIVQTNAIKLSNYNFAAEIHEAGVDLFNVGFHANSSALAEKIAMIPNGFKKTVQGMRNIKKLGARLRTTTVMTRLNYQHLSEIIQTAIDEGSEHVNISDMQPGGAAARCLKELFISYSEAFPYLEKAINLAVSARCVVTLEGFPYCAVPGHEVYQVNWEEQALKVKYRDIVMERYNRFLDVMLRIKGQLCTMCYAERLCGGAYKEYISHYGWSAFKAYENMPKKREDRV